jgi:hypothetical protein
MRQIESRFTLLGPFLVSVSAGNLFAIRAIPGPVDAKNEALERELERMRLIRIYLEKANIFSRTAP